MTHVSPQVKPSLDEVQDDSLVAMTNKHGKGKYWFKSGCPTPDPRYGGHYRDYRVLLIRLLQYSSLILI